MKTDAFDYQLPPEQIAQTPIEPRDASRLMVVHRSTGQVEHRIFSDIADYLGSGDLLVLNQTRVIPARLFGEKAKTGGRVELLLLKQRDDFTWEALVRGKGLRPGTELVIQEARSRPAAGQEPGAKGRAPCRAGAAVGPSLPSLARITAEILAETESGERLVRFSQPIGPLLCDLGEVPLPPYIHEPLSDPERYQTVYGHVAGSVAASTAGLHFTQELLLDLRRAGVELAFLTLHIGLDTFRPVKEESVEDHQIHTEWYELSPQVAEQINRARLENRRVVAVGTTVVRALESAAGGESPRSFDSGQSLAGAKGPTSEMEPYDSGPPACAWRTVSAHAGPTDLFIYPGYRFRVVQAMVTNFHLPRSTLLMLVSAFAGRELISRAYRQAIEEGYRFFSFGDAMLLL